MSDKTPEAAFAQALAAFQAELPNVSKGNTATVKSDKGNYSYSYADLTDITEVTLPLLAKHGMSWSARPTLTDGGFVLHYSLLHEGGHREDGDFPLPDPSRFSAQQIGSALTYARRYALCAVTGVAPGGDDDDGEKAQGATAADTLPRAPRRRGATTRSGAPDDPSQVVDEWTTPPTDPGWPDDAKRRLDIAGNVTEVEAIAAEIRRKRAMRQLTTEEADSLAAAVDQRLAEVTGVLA